MKPGALSLGISPLDVAGTVGGLQRDTPVVNEKDSPEAIAAAATDFEALLVHQMLTAMWQSVPQGGMLSGSREEGMFRDMLNDAVAKEIASGEGLGVKEVVIKDMERLAKATGRSLGKA